MLYKYGVTIPANRQEATPYIETLKVSKGILHDLDVVMPRGCMAMVDFRLFYHEHQIYPSNPDEGFKSEGEAISMHDHLPILTAPFEIVAKGWSPDTSYNHTIIVRMGILPKYILLPLEGLSGMLAKFFKLLGVQNAKET